MEEKMKQVPLEFICRHDRTAEVCRAAVEEDGWQLENVPEELKTPELCRKALETEAGFGNDFHRGLVQHIPSPEVCMEVLKECRENNPEELYGVAVAIRPEVMNGEMADFLLPLDGRCISILPVHLQTPERVRVAVETSGMSAVGRGGVPKSLLTPDVYVSCAAHSRESLMMIPWAERSPEVCLMAKTLYPDWVRNHPEFVPESVHNQEQHLHAEQPDGKPDGGKVQLPANDGLLQREAAGCETDGDAGRRAEGQGGEVRQGDREVLLLRHPAGAETGVEDVA